MVLILSTDHFFPTQISIKDGLAKSSNLVSRPKNRIFDVERLNQKSLKQKLKKQSKSENFPFDDPK